jgi:hypothetical protein
MTLADIGWLPAPGISTKFNCNFNGKLAAVLKGCGRCVTVRSRFAKFSSCSKDSVSGGKGGMILGSLVHLESSTYNPSSDSLSFF